MDKEHFLASGLLEQYVLGLTSEEESKEVERYADSFPEVKAEIESLQRAMEQYATQYAVPPPGRLKSKILNEIEDQDADSGDQYTVGKKAEVSRVRTKSGWPLILTFAMALVMALLAGNLYFQKKELENRLQETSASYATFQKQCEAEKARQLETEKVYAFLKEPGTRTIPLNGSSLAPEAVAVAYWNEEEKKGYVNLLNLPMPPAGKQYQIWADIDHEMVSMGLLTADNGKFQKIAFGENATSLNITLEPEGGSATPNVSLLYVNGAV